MYIYCLANYINYYILLICLHIFYIFIYLYLIERDLYTFVQLTQLDITTNIGN